MTKIVGGFTDVDPSNIKDLKAVQSFNWPLLLVMKKTELLSRSLKVFFEGLLHLQRRF